MNNIFGLALHETTEEIKECWETEERWVVTLLGKRVCDHHFTLYLKGREDVS